MNPIEYLVSALVTLLLVVDPIGLVPSFIAVTHGRTAPVRQHIAVRACIIAAAILASTALIGDWLLRTLGISLPAFRIAGGLMLFAVASEMVLGVRGERQSKQAEDALDDRAHDVAAFPLAIPLMAGPGAITATLLLASQARPQWLLTAILLGVIAAVVAACLGSFMLASRIDRLLGVTGNVVMSRLLGVILGALAVQYVIDGVRAVLAAS